MRKFLFSTVLLMFCLAANAQTKAVKFGPFGFIFGNYNARYEMGLNETSSLQFGANAYSYKLFDEKVSGFGLDAGYRYYFKEAIKGPYITPVINFDANKTTLLGQDGNFTLLGASALVGWQWVTGGGFLVDFGLGYGFASEISKDDVLEGEDYARSGARIQFTLGYAW
ncbi:MAG: DUF3575 domain-containing protein [Saprospiraceae bacterium]|nr:DUF3575 domain-containing protein [Saprospiraceae bacterium]